MFVAAGRMFFLLCYVLCTPYSILPTHYIQHRPSSLQSLETLKTLRTLETLQSSSIAVFEAQRFFVSVSVFL